MKQIRIETAYITLGQLLKKADVISTGGQVKWFLQETEIRVNGEKEMRRGRKLYPDDVIDIENVGKLQIISGRQLQ